MRRYVTMAVLCLGVAAPALGQLPTASIRGIVRDAQDAVLPGVTVTVTNSETGLTRNTVTNEQGAYRIPALPSGTYKAVAEMQGFQLRTWNVQLLLNQDAELNVMLVVAGLTEAVQVTSEAPLVDTTKSEMSRTFTSKQIADLPLPGRNYLNLMLSVPGATTGGTGASGFGVAVNGQRPRQVNFTIDGSDNNDASVTGTRSPIIQDAVGEFRLVTSVFGAELGRNTGAVAQAATKTGTNAFHGTAVRVLRGRRVAECADEPREGRELREAGQAAARHVRVHARRADPA